MLRGVKTLYWDFFGPNAEPTAAHFEKHLREFLERHGLACETGLESAGEGHHAARCRATEPEAERIAAALRPQRSE